MPSVDQTIRSQNKYLTHPILVLLWSGTSRPKQDHILSSDNPDRKKNIYIIFKLIYHQLWKGQQT